MIRGLPASASLGWRRRSFAFLLFTAAALAIAPALSTTRRFTGLAGLTWLLLGLWLALTMFAMLAMLLFPVRLFQGLQADLPNKVYKAALVFFRLAGADFDGFEVVGHDVLEVLLPDLSNSFNSKRVLFIAVRQDIPH